MAIRKQRPAGRLRVDAANLFLLHQIVPHVREFRATYPDIELELTASDQIVDLLERRIDVAIRIGSLDQCRASDHRPFSGLYWTKTPCRWWPGLSGRSCWRS